MNGKKRIGDPLEMAGSTRVIASDPRWKYLEVARRLTYIEQSIQQGIQWAASEPNDEPLWIAVRNSVRTFLRSLWRDGSIRGRTEEEAFFVKCDRTTMTQDDINSGRLVVIVGVAPVKPAEFVVIRITQATAHP